MARSMAAAWPVAGRAVADTKATAVSGENSVAGSSPSSFKVSVLRPFSSGWGSVRRTTTRPSHHAILNQSARVRASVRRNLGMSNETRFRRTRE